ncbi:MAG: hypothetical protein A3C85_00270 [Candidatus Doudnabacteria bacterium RIFCSPHIGHO2_02_FULL_48_21]|uniref:Uncharacterized protein n=1 Tax=Candidatus Doudnabacteria bacterium RIFCSPLOWO2_02_FULL_48_13 TaxID=1817845 RepID=A0A1F5QC65_9BACT|nr:MAG: hypothetical protein A3K05_01365 [Candidatus Doudnabacteria bacterium RIFCSPHIGHO2_01_48_18]OGE77531.1 MAG: hypothetical protein A2668_03560 [Candidatus Doudnabacteria bacterium RIFCSPHIGHO2_01_FULL_48_180]OGE91672.1 MAG: hypothetical protein A3F44_03120 [Candidatus Doudnabacteria bacterium RIFCSPHIGHO2_12_FULL_47_25]OGE93366.1 MAG: hypothetical protein A3C85_00270 [Candidatus Doudnabacteria bacterium RIFCSPHIGHO2_02_FULL_48_21]OGE97450.1 MAG: hypothetical protein A3A83_01205 [Candidatu
MSKKYLLICLGIIVLAAVVLLAMGRIPFCKCGVISVWSSDVTSNQQSQQLTDPYTLTHVLHGIAFYLFIWLFFGRRLTLGQRLILAVALESGWEILENTEFILNRYRAATISYDYWGDSVLNSVGDIFAMMIGFWMSAKLPWWGSLIAFIALDSLLLFFIRDSLIVNVIMLIRPIDAIKEWQTGK